MQALSHPLQNMQDLSRHAKAIVAPRPTSRRSQRLTALCTHRRSHARPSPSDPTLHHTSRHKDRCTPLHAAPESENAPSVALEGDLVTLHFTVFGEQGERLESSRDAGQPLSFEVGSSDAVGNELLQAFDGGVRGLAVGETLLLIAK